MSPDLMYALEKLSSAVYQLATGEGDVRSRLYDAFVTMSPISIWDLPDDFRVALQTIQAALTKRRPTDAEARAGYGRLGSTLAHMRNKTGSRIAGQIVALEIMLRKRVEREHHEHLT